MVTMSASPRYLETGDNTAANLQNNVGADVPGSANSGVGITSGLDTEILIYSPLWNISRYLLGGLVILPKAKVIGGWKCRVHGVCEYILAL